MTVYNAVRLNHCRFCGKHEIGDNVRLHMIKYGVRHYAHPDCFLEAGKDLETLSTYQLEHFPQGALDRRGISDVRDEMLKRRGELVRQIRGVISAALKA